MLKNISSIKQLIMFFIVIPLFNNKSIRPIDFSQLKDTYSILADEYKYCSPVYGAVWVETGILKKYYKYYAKDNLGHSKYHTVKLLQKIFYLVGESLSVTRNIGMPEHYLSPNLIGSIIGTIENSTTKDKKQLSEKIQKIFKENAQFLLETKAETKLDLKDDSVMNRRIKDLANAIVGSLNESSFWTGNSSLYPRYMTHAIFLACLYKISNEKVDLKEYFNTLDSFATKKIFTAMGKNIFDQVPWNSSKFDKTYLDSIIGTCAKQANLPPSKNVLSQLLEIVRKNYHGIDPFEALVCAEINKQFYNKSLPRVIEQNKKQPIFERRSYSDCTEVALRNLCNFVVFDQEKLMFIPVETDTIAPSKELYQYYQGDQADAKKHETPYMYQIWGDLLQNIPGVIYSATEFDRRLLGNDLFNQWKAHPCYLLLSQTDIKALNLYKSGSGLFYDLNINGEDYRVVDSGTHKAYALWPSLKNCIILLNYLFGLKLYDDPLAPFKDTTFCSTYFPLLCKKLGWNYLPPQYQLIFQPPPSLSVYNISLDTPYINWCHTIRMSLSKDPKISWDLHMKWHHAEIRNIQTPSISPVSSTYKQKLYDGLLESDDSMEIYALLALYASKIDEQKNKTIINLLNKDTVKNRFAMYLQDLDGITTEALKNNNVQKALKIAQGDIEVIKTKGPKNVVLEQLQQLRGRLLQLKNKLSLLKTKLEVLKKAL